MGSVDDGTDIRVELDEVALQRIQLGQIPCVDCGYLTKFFCNHCLPPRRFIPLCPRCELVNLQCHFCRGEDWCDLPGTWNHNSVIKHMLRQTMLPDHGYRPIAIGDLKNEEWLFKDRDKKWDPASARIRLSGGAAAHRECKAVKQFNRGCIRRLAYLSACVYTKVRLQPHPCYRV